MEGFQVSLGPLALPDQPASDTEQHARHHHVGRFMDNPSAAPTDRMMVGIFYADYRDTFTLEKETRATRRDGNAKSPFAMTTVKYVSTHSLHAQITRPFRG